MCVYIYIYMYVLECTVDLINKSICGVECYAGSNGTNTRHQHMEPAHGPTQYTNSRKLHTGRTHTSNTWNETHGALQ